MRDRAPIVRRGANGNDESLSGGVIVSRHSGVVADHAGTGRGAAGDLSRPAAVPIALGVAGAASGLQTAGAWLPVVEGAEPGYSSRPLLTALAVLPIAVAAVLFWRGRGTAAAGVLVGTAVLGAARVLLELQLAADPSVAARPELYLPHDLGAHAPAVGLWLLLAGDLTALLAGAIALRAVARPGQADLPLVGAGAAETDAESWRRRALLASVLAAVVAGCGIVMAPFGSDDVYLLARNAFEGPGVAMAGLLLLSAALPGSAALLITSSRPPDFARGGLVGLAVAVVVMTVPDIVTAVSMPRTFLGAGPIVALVGAAALLAVVALPVGSTGSADRLMGRRDAPPDSPGQLEPREAGVAAVPGRHRLQVGTGALAVLTALLAVAGSVTTQVSTVGPGPGLESPARWLLLSAGLLVGALGAVLFVPAFAPRVRPVLSVAWAGVLIAGTAVLDTAITATSLPGTLSAEPGVLWVWFAMCAAVLTACCSIITGLVEREDAEPPPDRATGPVTRVGLTMITPVALGMVLAIGAFVAPVVVAPGYVEPRLWSGFGTPSWGLLVGLLTVLGGMMIAPRSRPARAAGLLVGVACLLVLRAATLPLSSGHIEAAGAGAGLWLALAGAAAALVAAAIGASGSTPAGRIRTRSKAATPVG
jgi:hypothetical protein